MSKQAKDIIKWGRVKPFLDKEYNFNTIDLETIDNELFMLGYIEMGIYQYTLKNFYQEFHELLIKSVQNKRDILTWSRYDNTHLLKLILNNVLNVNDVLKRIGKLTPIYTYFYKGFTFSLVNIIKDSMIFKITDSKGRNRNVTIYNLKNLFTTDLETIARDYECFYSKMGTEYHIIDKKRFNDDLKYREGVIESNRLDNKVLIEIATKFINNFKSATGFNPKSIFTAGSIARSYLLAYNALEKKVDLQFNSIFKKKNRKQLLDYSMQSYHGGKIESYVLGSIKEGYIIDITSAYPFALSSLPKLTGKVKYSKNLLGLKFYYYAFIKCNIVIENEMLIHPIIVKSPINKSNISPYGYIKEVIITKIEYDYLISKGVDVDVIDYIGLESDDTVYPYKKLVNDLFNNRIMSPNKSMADMFKTILNSLYGITYELTDLFIENEFGEAEWLGFRAGDYFNPVIASYITAIIRTYLSNVSNHIVEGGGQVYLNMTDSIIYNGDINMDIFSDKKILGKFEKPTKIKDIIILGAGRYEYKDIFKDEFVIKNRGFNVSTKKQSFYSKLDLSSQVEIQHRTFVSSFKATTKLFGYKDLGHLVDDTYKINPFNLGGKRVIENYDVNLNKSYTKTKPVYIEKDFYL